MSFRGYPRPDGDAGTRSYVGVISAVAYADDVARWIAEQVLGCALFAHQQGCGQAKPDTELAQRTLLPVRTGASDSLR